MAEAIAGYNTSQIIRRVLGSPGSTAVFDNLAESVLIDNLGANAVYFTCDATISTGETMGYIPAGESRALDVRCGSVDLLCSGAGVTTTVQCIGLW